VSPATSEFTTFKWLCVGCGISREIVEPGRKAMPRERPSPFGDGTTFKLDYLLRDFQGGAVAGRKVEGDLCNRCRDRVAALLGELSELEGS